MSIRALRAANSAAQEAKALHVGISKQQQAVTKDSRELAQRLDTKGQARRLRELRSQLENAIADRDATRTKSMTNLVATVLATVGTVATVAVAAGMRMRDRAQGRLNPAEAARLEQEAGRKGPHSQGMAKFNRDQALQRVNHLQKGLQDKEAWGKWSFGLLGPGLRDRQALEAAKNKLAVQQQKVYEAGAELEVPSLQDRMPPHLSNDKATPKPVALDAKLNPEERQAKVPSEDDASKRQDAGVLTAASANVQQAQTGTQPPSAKGAEPAAAVGAPGRGPEPVPTAGMPARPARGGEPAVRPGNAAHADQTLAGPPLTNPVGNPGAPQQPDVSTADRTMPATVPADPTAVTRWVGGKAQPLPLGGNPAERLHTLMEMGRNGTLTRDVITANKDLFSADGYTRLQGAFLADMGAAHSGRACLPSMTDRELQSTLDKALGFGHRRGLTPAMREAMAGTAAGNLLDAVNAYNADPSAANKAAYLAARRDYEDLKYGDLETKGKLNMTGLLHLAGAELKQALESMELYDPKTGERQGDVIAKLMVAVEFARNTAEAAMKEDALARDLDGQVAMIMTMIAQAENEAGLYGVGPKAGGGGKAS
jgi:hypothetical protein